MKDNVIQAKGIVEEDPSNAQKIKISLIPVEGGYSFKVSYNDSSCEAQGRSVRGGVVVCYNYMSCNASSGSRVFCRIYNEEFKTWCVDKGISVETSPRTNPSSLEGNYLALKKTIEDNTSKTPSPP